MLFNAASLVRQCHFGLEDELISGSLVSLPDGSFHFSLDKYLRTVLKGRPLLLKIWKGFIKLVRRLLKQP